MSNVESDDAPTGDGRHDGRADNAGRQRRHSRPAWASPGKRGMHSKEVVGAEVAPYAGHAEGRVTYLYRANRSLVGNQRLDELSAQAVAHAGTPLPDVPDDLLIAVVGAWQRGDVGPLAYAAAQWAWMNSYPLRSSDASDALVGCLCELSCRGYPNGPLLVRTSAASEFGMGGAAQDRVGEEFISIDALDMDDSDLP